NYTLATHAAFKKDIAARLAHKIPYVGIETKPEEQLDILIVVDQMLTGYDSKWINTLYMDKVLYYEHIIQAFSRTNRLFGPDKPFGTIRYYRKPHSMERNVNAAIKLYSGDKPRGLFVDKLAENLSAINSCFDDIKALFESAGIAHFERLPDDSADRGQFAKLFNLFNVFLEAAKIQGFKWSKLVYKFGKGPTRQTIEMHLDENTYLILVLRYKELFTGEGGTPIPDIPYPIDGYITEIDTGRIDSDYMNSRCEKYIKELSSGLPPEELQKTLNEL